MGPSSCGLLLTCRLWAASAGGPSSSSGLIGPQGISLATSASTSVAISFRDGYSAGQAVSPTSATSAAVRSICFVLSFCRSITRDRVYRLTSCSLATAAGPSASRGAAEVCCQKNYRCLTSTAARSAGFSGGSEASLRATTSSVGSFLSGNFSISAAFAGLAGRRDRKVLLGKPTKGDACGNSA